MNKRPGVIFLDNKAFDLIADKVGEALDSQGFVRQKVDTDSKSEQIALYTGEGSAYSVLFDGEVKKYFLRSCAMTDEGPDNQWKNIAVWLFDPETDSTKEAESIAADFVETVEGPKRKAIVQQQNKKKKKSDEGNVDPLFFCNRLVNVFPSLKDDIRFEKEHYPSFRGVTFAREKIVPQVQYLLRTPGEQQRKEKLFTILDDVYNVGDLDVRGIITMVILNSIEGDAAETAREAMTPALQKAWKNSLKYKGKNVKPEKKKKPKKSFMGSTLNDMRR